MVFPFFNFFSRSEANVLKKNKMSGSGSNETEEMEEAVQKSVLLVVCIIVILSNISRRLLAKYNVVYASESFVTIMIGFFVGCVMYYTAEQEFVDDIKFDERTFTNFILPPIIFDAGFSLRHKGVVENMSLIFSLAVFGTLLTTLIIGGFTFWIASTQFTQLHARPVWESMCFGAILSAIDPVAVLSVLGSLFKGRKPPRIYYIIFGESVLNDAVAIVLYRVFVKFLEDERDPDFGTVMVAIAVFLKISVISVVIGWTVAALSSAILKYVNFSSMPDAELTILTLFGFGSYYIAEAMGMSGIMALFICGRTSCHYGWHNMSTVAQVTAPQLFHFVAGLAETYVFSFLGLAFWTFDHEWRPGFTIALLIVIFLSRACTVFPIVNGINLFEKKGVRKVSLRAQFFMTLTGLRGAIAFGLALSANENRHIESGGQFVTTSLIIIVVTVGVFGNFSAKLFSLLKLDLPEQDGGVPSEIAPQGRRSITRRCLAVEKKYIAPFLRVRDHADHDTKRRSEITSVLDDLNDRFAVKSPQVPGQDPNTFSSCVEEELGENGIRGEGEEGGEGEKQGNVRGNNSFVLTPPGGPEATPSDVILDPPVLGTAAQGESGGVDIPPSIEVTQT